MLWFLYQWILHEIEEELNLALKTTDEEKKKKSMLRNELLLRRDMHAKDSRDHPELYKVNSMSVTQMKVNLAILLSGQHDTGGLGIVFPDAETMFDELHLVSSHDKTSTSPAVDVDVVEDVALNEPCVAIWDTSEGREWFVGMTREKVGPEEFIVDYLEQVPNDSSKRKWQYPSKTDEQKTLRIQFLSCNVMGTWDLNKRKPVFVLHNNDVIDELFKGLYLLQ